MHARRCRCGTASDVHLVDLDEAALIAVDFDTRQLNVWITDEGYNALYSGRGVNQYWRKGRVIRQAVVKLLLWGIVEHVLKWTGTIEDH